MRSNDVRLMLLAAVVALSCGDTADGNRTAPSAHDAGASDGRSSKEGGRDEPSSTCDACDPVATCNDAVDPVTCACPAGYADTKGDGSVCTDIDECATGAHFCDATAGVCTNTPGGFTCACPAGYHDLGGNGTACEPLALYSASPFQGFLFQNETAGFSNVGCLPITLPGATVRGATAMAKHPTTGTVYAVLKVESDRVLATLDLATGNATSVGPLGDKFSALAFTPDGATLYGVTGDGAATPATLFTIDPQTAARTQIQSLGNGGDGEAIAFDGAGTLHHWSGNGTVVTETIQIGAGTTEVAFPATGETFGAVWWSWHQDAQGNPDPVFLISTIESNFRTLSPTTGYSTEFGSTPDDVRGLVFDRNHGYVRGAAACP